MHRVTLALLVVAQALDLAPLSKLRAVSLARPPESRLIAGKLDASHVALWKWKAATMGDGGMASEDLSLAAGCSMLHFYLVYPHHGTLEAAEEAGMLTAAVALHAKVVPSPLPAPRGKMVLSSKVVPLAASILSMRSNDFVKAKT